MNTNAKHSPGPWTAANQDTETNEIPIKCGKSILARVAPRPHWDDTQEANARLIAAAPELLAALKGLFEHCAMIHRVWGDGSNQKEADAAIAAGKAAIAQAEGGAQ